MQLNRELVHLYHLDRKTGTIWHRCAYYGGTYMRDRGSVYLTPEPGIRNQYFVSSHEGEVRNNFVWYYRENFVSASKAILAALEESAEETEKKLDSLKDLISKVKEKN